MEHLDLHSMDVAKENFKKLAALFPNCVTETVTGKDELGNDIIERTIDKDLLAQEINGVVVDGPQERYQFNWPGKRESIKNANATSENTLRPCKEESVDFDNTQNLYIEGDNLEVLKLLQNNYLGKIKMIYIDPPYNTGNDFVYNDDFTQDADLFNATSGMFDADGNMTLQNFERNSESNGRFHTDWLNMMYPRLKIARNLLHDDGVIFISIDDNEVVNCQKLCDEIFGSTNKIGLIANVNNPKGRSDDKFVATAHEYLLVYAKSINSVEWLGFEPTDVIIKRYNKTDENGKKYREIDLRKTGEMDLRQDRPNMFYYFYFNEQTKEFFPSKIDEEISGFVQIKPMREDGREGRWRWGFETAKQQISTLTPKFMPSRKIWGVMEKDFLEGRALVKPTSAWTFKDVNSERGTEEFVELGFDSRIFPKPKPIGTIERTLKLNMKHDDTVLDFFSGSATTAHAVFSFNAKENCSHKFICVQLPEKTTEESDAFKAGFKNICEIGKERIRRAGEKIREKYGLTSQNLDIGFRVLKLADSNFEKVKAVPKDTDQTALEFKESNIKKERKPIDLLFQALLEFDIPLSCKIEEKKINGKTVFFVEGTELVACFDENVDEKTIEEIAKTKPYYFVMRDSSYASDNVADNFEQIFNAYSKETICKVM